MEKLWSFIEGTLDQEKKSGKEQTQAERGLEKDESIMEAAGDEPRAGKIRKRLSGILMPVSSLPSRYGIGCFSKEAYEFIDMLVKAGQGCWQILPLGPTSYGDSPYQSFSTFAGNPYFIDLEKLIHSGLLSKEECGQADFGHNALKVNYGKLYEERYSLLWKAFERSGAASDPEFCQYCESQQEWLEDYCLFMAVKDSFGGKAWSEWDEDIRLRTPDALAGYRNQLAKKIQFHQYLQFMFDRQWKALKSYANEKGVRVIGDVPIYVSFDSADAWANPELFQFDESLRPTAVAGCPPDGFSATGQLWGNPLYDWDYHKNTGYQWWIRRMQRCKDWFDVVRIDHFRGFDEYYAIPYGDETAEFGTWKPGPGLELFEALNQETAGLDIIAEDLGFLTDSVKKMVADSGYPGMKVLEFAFDSRDDSDYYPHNYTSNCVVYTGTHDNETLMGWLHSISKKDKRVVLEFLGLDKKSREAVGRKDKPTDQEICWSIIRLAMESVADLCMIPMQDYLGYDNRARINQPSTLGINWQWRMGKGAVSKKLVKRIRKITSLYGRLRT